MAEQKGPFHKYRVKNLKFGAGSINPDHAQHYLRADYDKAFSNVADDFGVRERPISDSNAIRLTQSLLMAKVMDHQWLQYGEKCLMPGHLFKDFRDVLCFEIELIPESPN